MRQFRQIMVRHYRSEKNTHATLFFRNTPNGKYETATQLEDSKYFLKYNFRPGKVMYYIAANNRIKCFIIKGELLAIGLRE